MSEIMKRPIQELTEQGLRAAVARIGMMKFCPSDPDFRIMLGKMLSEMCHNDEQLKFLSEKLLVVFPEWPGIYEVRACACSSFKVKDGFEVDSVLYPDGIPSVAELQLPALSSIPPAARRLDLPPAKQIEAYQRKQLAAPYSDDPELDALVKDLAKPLPPRQARTIEEIRAELYENKA